MKQFKRYAVVAAAAQIGGTLAVFYHDVVVVELEAIKDPGGRREEGGDRQREGQTLNITTANDLCLQEEEGSSTQLAMNYSKCAT